MQKDGVKLADCSFALDHLIDSVQENYDDGSSDCYQCLLGTDHIAPNSSKLKSSEFTSGVIKIQNGASLMLQCLRFSRKNSNASTIIGLVLFLGPCKISLVMLHNLSTHAVDPKMKSQFT